METFSGPELTIAELGVKRLADPSSLVMVTAVSTYLPTSAETNS
jgi:hypothetical protein